MVIIDENVEIRCGVTSENLNAHVGRSTYRRARLSEYSLNGYATSIDVEEDLKLLLTDPDVEWYIFMYGYILYVEDQSDVIRLFSEKGVSLTD